MNKLREKVARKAIEKSSAGVKDSETHAERVDPVSHSISIDAEQALHSESVPSTDEQTAKTESPAIQAHLFVDGMDVICSQQLAQFLTSNYQFQSNDLRMFTRSGELAEADAKAIEWLCAGNHLLQINII